MKTSILALLAGAATTVLGHWEFPAGVPKSVEEFRAKHPYTPKANNRRTVCIRSSKNDTDDISDEFLQGLKKAMHGGTLVLPEGKKYVIGKPLDLTFLDDVQIRLDGEIMFTNDTAYWQANAFHHPFQNSIYFTKWGGKDVKIEGTGVLNGNGQRWWNEFGGGEILSGENAYLRPILFYAQNATRFSMEGIHLKDSPCWTTFWVTSQDISIKDVACTAETKTQWAPKNTDFFDSLNVKNLEVERVWVNIGDDCFSPKTNLTNAHVSTMYCNGTHGQSMGSIGQYAGEKSIIEDVVIEDVWMLNGQHAARLKSWAGPDVGYGYINNITFRNFYGANNEYTAFIDSCYFNINATECAQYPSQVNLTNINFENFQGYSSGKYGRAVARLTCSPAAVCENITFTNFNITSPCGGPSVVICDGISGDIGIPCVNSTSAEAVAALKDTCTTTLATLPQPTPW